MDYFWYIFFGLAPSIIWLLFFLLHDRHPESERMVLKIFLYGIVAAVVVVLADYAIKMIGNIDESSLISIGGFVFPWVFLSAVMVAPILEEIAKYLVVRLKVIRHSEFDEPVDAMIYMIVAALGLAAAENLLYLAAFDVDPLFFSAIRFIGATFLHALCSAIVGYYLALSFFNLKNRFKLICTGLLMAIVFHGLFNFFMIKFSGGSDLFGIALVLLLAGLAIFVIYGFEKVKKLKSVCKE